MKSLQPNFSIVKVYTMLLLITSILGVHIVSLNVGAFQLSPYRLLILFSPLMLLNVDFKYVERSSGGANRLYFKFMSFWVLYSIASLFWIEDFDGWMRIFLFFLSAYITTRFIGWYLTSHDDIINSLRFVEFLALLFSLFGVYEIATGNYLFILEDSVSYYGNESLLNSSIGYRIPISIFGNPNHYAVFLLFACGFSFCLTKVKKSSFGKTMSMSATLLFVFLLIATQSRAAFMGLLLAIAAYFFINARKTNVVKVVAIGIVSFAIFIPILVQYFDVFEPLLSVDSNENSSDLLRQNLLKNGWDFLEQSYFIGVGLGNIEYHMGLFGRHNTGGVTNIHNWWMEIFVSSGVAVMVFYIIVYVKNLKLLYKINKVTKNKDAANISIVFFALMVGFIVASIGPSSLLISEWFLPLIAIIMAFTNQFKN